MLQFIDNTPTYDEDTGVSFFACGLAEEEEAGEQDYRVVYMSPFGAVIHSRRSKDGVTVSDISDEVIERFQAAHGTPSARWRRLNDPDPHDQRYDIERSQLAMGNCSDDEIANGVYLYGNSTPTPMEIITKKAKMPIVYLTAAKDRIRWLSRRLEDALESGRRVRKVAAQAGALLREYEKYHVAKGTEDSLAKAERNRRMAEKLESVVTQGIVG